jgi:hypothetical protein
MKMMRKTLLLVVGCLMCGKMNAQHQQLFDEYRRKAGDQAEMFVGKVEPGYPPTIYLAHPYWLFDEFFPGDVVYNGLLYKSVPVRYDAYLKRLVVNTPNKRMNVYVPMNLVEKFTLGGTEFSWRYGEIVAILFSSSRMELVEQVNVALKENIKAQGQVMYDFNRDVRYYVLRGGEVYEVDKLRSVLKLFPGREKVLKRYAKENALDFKLHRQSALITMIKYADELLAQPLK